MASVHETQRDSVKGGGLVHRTSSAGYLWLVPIVLVLLALYFPGLKNQLVFDDELLTEGGLFQSYGSIFPPKARLLAYGSFVWAQELFGAEWWKQRLFNLLIHIGVVFALWGFYRELLRHVVLLVSDGHGTGKSDQEADIRALAVGIGFFAVNPVAVYAVAYLIQRSILLATLFVVIGLWAFLRSMASGRWPWFVLSVMCYLCAIASKEHALMAPAAAIPLYIIARRPPARSVGLIVIGSVMAIAGGGAVFYKYYGEGLLGVAFDELSRIYLRQLASLVPDIEQKAHLLSIVNQSYLFLEYGFRWIFPYAGLMSIDMRTPFPQSALSFPYVLGPIAYLTALVGGFAAVLHWRDWRALVGVALFLPAILFATEFATVWVQDPFVLYRSYLWAIGVPGIIMLLVHGLSPRVTVIVGAALMLILSWQALDRVLSFSTPMTVWSDAIGKISEDPRAVGRWRAYLNRGEIYFRRGAYGEAIRDFEMASAMGDFGKGLYNKGVAFYMEKRYSDALSAFDAAKGSGYDLYNLPYQKGLALLGLGRLEEANGQFDTALKMNPPAPLHGSALAYRGMTALDLGRVDEAAIDLREALRESPGNSMAKLSLAMVHVLKEDYQTARDMLTAVLADRKSALAYYGRAKAFYGLRDSKAALEDIENAIRLDPKSLQFMTLRDNIRALPE